MSHAEYASKQVPVLARLVTALRQMPVVQSAFAKFKALLRMGAEPPRLTADARLDRTAVVPNEAIEIVDAAAAVAEPVAPPRSDADPEPVPADALVGSPLVAHDATEAGDAAPMVAEPTLLPLSEIDPEPVIVDAFAIEAPAVAEEVIEAADVAPVVAEPTAQTYSKPEPLVAIVDAFVAETPAMAKAPAATGTIAPALAKPAEEDREALVRRRWRETGIRMWNAGQSVLRIQGRTALLPPKPGETMPQYDTLEIRLIGGDIVCEGFVLEPPERTKQRLVA